MINGCRGRRIRIFEWFFEIFKKIFLRSQKRLGSVIWRKPLISYKVWWKVFDVVESESSNGFSKFSKRISSLQKPFRKAYLEKLLISQKVWWKVFEVVESESMNNFYKFWKNLFVWKNVTEAFFGETIDIS